VTDRVPVASEALIRERARKLVADGGARVLVVRARPRWTGPPSFPVGNATVWVRPAVSQLAALDALANRGDDYLVLLTDREDADLGDAVLVQAYGNQVQRVDEWGAIPGLYNARTLDPALSAAGPWVAPALLEHQPPGGWPAAPSGTVTADHALGNLLGALLHLALPAELDAVTLLTELDEPESRAAWQKVPEPLRRGLAAWAGRALGEPARMALAAAARGPVSVVAIGLALDVLWPSDGAPPEPEQAAARGRVEQWLERTPVSPRAAQAYAAVSRTLALRAHTLGDERLPSVLAQAEALLGDVRWAVGAERSRVLPRGLTARLHRLASLLAGARPAALAAALPSIEGALGDVAEHEAADARNPELVAARMAVRLARRLADEPDRQAAPTLGSALREYLDDGAWIDRAAAVLWDGSTDATLAEAYRTLLESVRAVRDRYDRAAARLLAADTAADRTPDRATVIERVLPDVVWPLGPAARPLVVLLDGMSAPVATELTDAITADGWVELVPEPTRRRVPVLAALPSLTRWSRTAFFTGTPGEGGQAAEVAALRDRFGAPLFHKDDLRSPAGAALAEPVRAAIDDARQRMVAVVLNTIDDALDKHDPGGTRWGVDDVQHLRALLNQAAIAGRTVVLTSDHGHVVERGSTARSVPGAQARWRPAGAPAGPDEVLVRGGRVMGGEAVLAVDEGLRYGPLRSGYHGGASLAEVTVPLVVLTRPGTPAPAGWRAALPQAPVWWNEENRVAAGGSRRARRTLGEGRAAPATRAARVPAAPQTPEAGQGVLAIDLPGGAPDAVAPARATGLVADFEASEVLAAQRRRAGRHALPQEVVSAVVATLLGDGRAHRDTVARALGVPAGSFVSTFAALGRLLNVEGYPVVSLDPDGVTVRFDRELFTEQFDLRRTRG